MNTIVPQSEPIKETEEKVTLPQQGIRYFDPTLNNFFYSILPRENTKIALELHKFCDNSGNPIIWTPGQLEIIDTILYRSSYDGKKRIQIIASTQYGKSLAVAAGIVIRASAFPEKWAIVAGTTEKARIIMEHVIMLSLNTITIRQELDPETPLDRLRMKRSADRLVFRLKGEIRVYSAEAKQVMETSKALMGFGSPNVIEDEAALIGDVLQATVMRMLGASKDNFLVKIGNPFNRGHFYRTWLSGLYHRIFIDCQRAISEGRYSEEFINEMSQEALFDILYECKFPKEGTIDIKGWMPLLTSIELERSQIEQDYMFGDKRLGCDVAGGGRNFSAMVARAYNLAKVVFKENLPDTMAFTGSILVKQKELAIKDRDIFIDLVGIGRGAHDRLKEQKAAIVGVGGAESSSENQRFANLRAEMYWRAREWILNGGKLLKDPDWSQLLNIKYKVDSSGRLKIMSKEEMLREGIDSPDIADAFVMTFARADVAPAYREQLEQTIEPAEINDDPYF